MERKIFNDKRIYKIAEQIAKSCLDTPRIGLVLGSGWGSVCDDIENKKVIPYHSLKGMPTCSVKGHSGNFVFGKIGNKNIIAAQGRFHLYEGKDFSEVLMPLRIMYALGIDIILLTNAAGGLNKEFRRGDLMVIRDHINFTFQNPLTGAIPEAEYPVFCDMSQVYDYDILNALAKASNEAGLRTHLGTYMQVLGPCYETPAEIRAYSSLGADAIGMSTVVEAIYAKYLHLRVGAVSTITNMGTGIEDEKLDHRDVLVQASKDAGAHSILLKNAIYLI